MLHAQNAGARPGGPFSRRRPDLARNDGEKITIPAVMISGNDGYAILDVLSPGAPPYNAGTVNATLNDNTSGDPRL